MNTILLVEDSVSFAGLLKSRLQRALGVEVLLARCYAEAKALLQLHSERFFLAVLDLHLPDALDGQIVDLVVSQNLPAIVLTGKYQKELQNIVLQKGILDYFIKDNPRVMDSVIHAIERIQKNKYISILVVDDSRSARMTLTRFLGRYGFNILDVEDGSKALQCLAEHKIHLVITDYQMPVMDGLQFVRKLRASHSRNDLAAIGLSSYGNSDLATQFIKAGANDFLVKPYQPEELLCRVYQNIENIEHDQDIARHLDRHEAILTHALDAIVTTDDEGRVLEFNPAAEQLFGYSKAVVVGKKIVDFVIPESLREAHQTGLLRFAKQGLHAPRLRRRMDYPGIRADGQVMDLQISLTSVVQQGKMQFTAFLQDVTDKRQLLKSLEETLAVAESANKAKSDFIANMSHEIRTPMNAILGFNDLALKADLAPRVRDYLEKIGNASHSLMGIISDLLDFSKLEAGQMTLDPVLFDLHLLLERLADLFSKQVADKKLELVFSMPSFFDGVLFGDVIRLEQLLINLIRNAVKFTEKGTITVTVTPTIIEGNRVCLTCRVRDTGIGMDPQILPNLFAPFVQADGSITRKYGGTGLGLSICKRLVVLMGGRMWSQSVLGEGSEFAFELSVDLHGPNRRKPRMLPEALWGKKVLVVDDNPLVLEALQSLLKDLLLEPEGVQSGVEAVARVTACNIIGSDPFAYVLLDWRMPGMDGDVAAVEIRAVMEASVPRTVMPKLFLMSPFGVKEAISKGEKAGVDGLIDKPITRSRLLRGLSVGTGEDDVVSDRRREKLLGQEESTGERIGGSRILLAQANEINQRITCELLERVGLVVECARDGKEAVEWTSRFAYDAMLIDFQVPEWGVMETLAQMRVHGRSRDMPVIVLLSRAGWEEKKLCLDIGAKDHLDLPIRAERLYGVLCKWVQSIPVRPDPEGFLQDDHAFVRVSGLDVAVGLERIAGKKSLYRRLLVRFCHAYGGVVASLRGLMQEGRHEPARAIAHAIKGAARNLGAFFLAEAAETLEYALASDDAVACHAAMATFAYRMNAMLNGLGVGSVSVGDRQELAEGGRFDAGQLDLTYLGSLLAALLDRLGHFSIEVEPWLGALGQLLEPTEAFFTFQELVKQIDQYHFCEAMELLQGLSGSFGCVLNGISSLGQEDAPRPRVLIVDDQVSNVDLLKAILVDFHRMVALNGQQALQAAQSDQPPDLILLDIMMPEMNGYDVCRQLQINPRTKTIPVIFVTAKKQVADEAEGFALGGVDYITKPFKGEIVKRRVMTHLELKRYRDELVDEVQSRTTELLAAREEAERAREAAEAGNRAKSTFLAHMSHEIRTPLNAILGVNELLVETQATAEQRHYLEMSRKASESLLALVNDVLDFSKIEAGQFDLECSCFDLHALIEGAVEILKIQARDRGIQLSQRMDAALPRHVLGDPNRLRQILLNLMGNAIKFTLRGEVVLVVNPTEEGRIYFAIADTGIGIPADKLLSIFHPFRQADLSTTRQYGGTGLGLTICALLVENMGGRIQVESTEGKGSLFYFTLELPVPKQDAPVAVVSVVRQGVREQMELSGDGAEGLKILMAEDSEDNRILIKAFLNKSPHQLEFAQNGQVAWEKFRQTKYDIILMDIQMPIMDGYAATRKIREREREKGLVPTPVIALTAHAMQEAATDAMEAGCDYYLTKPIAKKRLLEVLQQFARKGASGNGG
ncbi:MAG: response regulator [Magnetococcus sp. YQC-5]